MTWPICFYHFKRSGVKKVEFNLVVWLYQGTQDQNILVYHWLQNGMVVKCFYVQFRWIKLSKSWLWIRWSSESKPPPPHLRPTGCNFYTCGWQTAFSSQSRFRLPVMTRWINIWRLLRMQVSLGGLYSARFPFYGRADGSYVLRRNLLIPFLPSGWWMRAVLAPWLIFDTCKSNPLSFFCHSIDCASVSTDFPFTYHA